jgi:hypothetical protein
LTVGLRECQNPKFPFQERVVVMSGGYVEIKSRALVKLRGASRFFVKGPVDWVHEVSRKAERTILVLWI